MLEHALRRLKASSVHSGEVERAIADYCRERFHEGVLAETVIIEIKRIAHPILRDEDRQLERLVTRCIEHFYGAAPRPT